MKKGILYIIFLFCICSCKTKKKTLIHDLCNNNYKYWYRYNKDTLKPYSIGFCFYKNGTYVRYINTDAPVNKRKRLLDNDPVYPKPYWEFIDDTAILFDKVSVLKIIFFNQDSLILQDLTHPNRGYLKLHRENDQETKIDTDFKDRLKSAPTL